MEDENIFDEMDGDKMPGEDSVNFENSNAIDIQSSPGWEEETLFVLNNRENNERTLSGGNNNMDKWHHLEKKRYLICT